MHLFTVNKTGLRPVSRIAHRDGGKNEKKIVLDIKQVDLKTKKDLFLFGG